MIFGSTWAFLLLLLLPLIFLIPLPFKSKKRGLPFSNSYQLQTGSVSLRQRLIWLPNFLITAGLVLAVIALARPGEMLDESRTVTEGVAMELVIDRSGSMNAELEQGRKYVRRIDIVRKIILDFILGNDKNLQGRHDDLVGLIAFARYADTLSPLSLSHEIIGDFIESLDTVKIESEDGTSLGDAIALAATRLNSVEKENQPEKGYTIKSKVIILLTDGENNAGKYSPLEAAELAKKWGIKIYAIGFSGKATYTVNSLFGPKRVDAGSAVNSGVLKQLSEYSGGAYFQANTAKELAEVYAVIDKLEKSEVISYTHIEYKELFPIFLLYALIFLAIGKILALTILRRLP